MLLPNDRDIEDKLRELNPELWAAFYPRAYESRGNYTSPKQAAASMMLNVLAQVSMPTVDEPTRHATLTSIRLAEFSMPTYFVSAGLLHACLQTALPDGFRYSDLRWPMPAMLFILPVGAVQSPQNGPCNFLSIARHTPGRRTEHLPGLPPFPNEFHYDCFSYYALTEQNAAFAGYIPAQNDPMISELLAGERNYSPGFVGLSATGAPVFATIQGSDEDFISLTASICLRLLLLLNARPDLLTPSRELRKASTSPRKVTAALWSPNIIGEKYRVTTDSTSSHASRSPRLHWRRGHYRNQPHGPGLTQRKIIWIEPVLVSAE